MPGNVTVIAGIPIPSTSLFLAVVGVRVALGIACTLAGVIAMQC